MNTETLLATRPAPNAATALTQAIAAACARIAPLWPLDSFVAVNPFLGFTGQSFAGTCAMLRRVAGIDVLMPRGFYRAELGLAAPDAQPPGPPAVATVAEVLDALAGGDKQASRTAFMIDEISKWCAGYFDAGQAAWPAPFRDLPPYAAWRAAMRHDRNAEAMGITGFRRLIARLPEDPVAAIHEVVAALDIPPDVTADYLYRALLDIGGWAGHARYLGWPGEPAGASGEALLQLLAIRVAWGYALFCQRTDSAFQTAWRAALARPATADTGLAADLALHEAYEARFQRHLAAQLARPAEARLDKRPVLQAAFCIDVRSEIFRRGLETACPGAETYGFAGFFGFAFEYVRLGEAHGTAQCPVLLQPEAVIRESGTTEAARARTVKRQAARAWQAFKQSAAACFAFVEGAGLLFAGKLARDSFRLDFSTYAAEGAPLLDNAPLEGRQTGLAPARRVELAEAALRGMSLTGPYARLVLLAGHGSTSSNNPFAAGLDCGACGGHTGQVNARVAASVLNDPSVRVRLRARGLPIPEDTHFVAALHDTTTDDVRLFDTANVPASHAQDLAQLRQSLAQAGALARQSRAPLLGVASAAATKAVRARSRDWAQTRPEWGLAGNAAFIAAPRTITRGLDLQGRAFLHSYDWRTDTDFRVLDLIMTAPMVVASWINLQYFAASTNNEAFGSGNKVLHNVAGRIGVLEGNAGDLRPGLPWQTVHDGKKLIHEPIRLNVVLAAPEAAIEAVLAKHASVRNLADHHWLHLFTLPGAGQALRRYHAPGHWETLT